jgi:hypothetical protein
MRVGLLLLARCLQQQVEALVCSRRLLQLQLLQAALGVQGPPPLVFDPLLRHLAVLGAEKR